MTQNYFTPVATGANNGVATLNNPLGELDAAITTTNAELLAQIANIIAQSGSSDTEVVNARDAGHTGGAVATLATRLAYAAANAWHPMAYGAVGDGSTDDRAALNTLFNTTISGATAYAIIDRAYKIGADLTIPGNVRLQFMSGGKFTVDTFSVRSASWQWTSDGAGRFYLSVAGTGASPSFSEPSAVYENGVPLTKTAKGMLSASEWAWGARTDGGHVGEMTIYARLSDSADPDSKASGFVTAAYKLTINGPITAGPQQIVDNYATLFGTAAFDRIYPQWFYTSGDWTKAIQAALTTATQMSNTGSKPIVFLPPGQVYDCDTGITVDCGKNVLHGAGSVLDFSGGSGIRAITITQTTVDYRHDDYSNPILQGLILRGDGIGGSSTGIHINGVSHIGGVNVNASIHNVTINSFETGIDIQENAWGLDVQSFNIYDCAMGVTRSTATSAPERLAFSNGKFSACTVAVEQGDGMFYFSQCSFDYNTKIYNGTASVHNTFDQCHFEQSVLPFMTAVNVALHISNSTFWYPGATDPATLITYAQDFASPGLLIHDCTVEAGNWIHIHVVGGTGRVRMYGMTSKAAAGTGSTPLILCEQTNLAPSYTFEGAGGADGWALAGSAVADGTHAHGGTVALRLFGASQAAFSTRCERGQLLHGEMWIYTAAGVTSSNIIASLTFLAQNGTTSLGTHAITRNPTTVTAETWTKIGFRMHVGDIPAGTQLVQFLFNNAAGGSVWVDDIIINLQ